MGRWLDKYKKISPECGGEQTDIADTGAVKGIHQPLDPRREGKKARELLNRLGWCAIRSYALGGEVIVWLQDNQVLIPERWQENVRYSLDEIKALLADGGVTQEGLRRIHEAKRIFSGTVCRAKEP